MTKFLLTIAALAMLSSKTGTDPRVVFFYHPRAPIQKHIDLEPPIVKASFYADFFAGRTMANGEPFDPDAMTVAHLRYKLGTKLKLTNVKTRQTAMVVVSDRGPYAPGSHGKEASHKFGIDLAPAVADALGIEREAGWGTVKIQVVRR